MFGQKPQLPIDFLLGQEGLKTGNVGEWITEFIAYSSDQLGLFQETPAYISRYGSTLQNASHFLIQNNEKIGKKRKILFCLHERFELQLSWLFIFKEI